jgi:ribosome-associated protein
MRGLYGISAAPVTIRTTMKRAPRIQANPSVPDAFEQTPSKSQRKRDSHALQTLGASLLEMSDERLGALPLPARVIEAIQLAREIRAREGKRRQIQYIGRLMRDVDQAALQQALESQPQQHRLEVALMHATEQWRARLMQDEQARLDWCERYPHTRETVVRLITQARQELAGGAPGRRFRELFRLVRDTLTEQAQAAQQGD